MTNSALPAPKIGLDLHRLLSLLDANIGIKINFLEMLTKINEKHGNFIVIYYPSQEKQPVYFTPVKDINQSKTHIALCVVLVVLQKYLGDASKALESGQEQLYQEIIMGANHNNIPDMSKTEIMKVIDIFIKDLI